MVNSIEEILLRIGARDSASQTFWNIDKNAQSMASNISSAISSIDSSMANFGQVTNNIMQGLTGKSAMDNIIGTSSKAETNKVLLNNMTQTKEGAEALYETVDKVTDSSLTSMQELIPAMKAFKSATGASDKEMTHITDEMANFGAAVLAQTGSTDMAQQSMMDLSKGIKGAFASLDQYGITQASLERTGYWNGDEKDVEGFMKAVQKVTGSTDELMETNQGLDALIGKAFSRAGKKMGNEFLPQIKDIKRAFLDFDDSVGGGLSASILAVSGAVEVANTGFTNVTSIVRGIEDLSKAFSTVKNITSGAKKVEEAIDTVSDVGSLAGDAGAAAAGAESTAVATTTLSGAFTSMIVPMLALSATIAIMIPIAAALAAEALLFLKGVQIVFDALDFGGIDLNDDIGGIKQLAEGLLWVGAAMGALAIVNVTTSIAAATSMFLGITGPLKIAKDALLEASKMLKEFSTVGIDPSVPNNLKNISESLTAVSNAMLSLTGTTITTGFSNFVAWVFGFSSTTEALGQAKNDLIKASTAINELASGITPLPEEDASKIQNVCDSLASVGDAIGALRSIRDGQNWDNIFGGLMEGLFGKGVDIKTALDNVKGDVEKAAVALSGWTDLKDVPEGIGDKVKKVSDTLSSLSESFEALRSLRDSVNWDSFMGGIFKGVDIQTALTNIKTELYLTATNLNGLQGMPTVSEGLGDKIKTVTDTVGSVSEAATGLTSVPDMGSYDPANLSTAVTNVQTAATELSKLNETTFNGDAANGVLGSISTTIETLKTTLSGASGFSEPAMNIGTEIVNGVKSGLSPLASEVTGAVSSATNSSASAGWTGGAYIGTSLNGGFKSSLDLHTTMTNEMNYVKTAVDNGISAAKTAAQNGAHEIVQAFQAGINVGSPGDIARTMKQELLYTEGFINDATYPLSQAGYGVAKSIVDSFGTPELTVDSLSSKRFNSSNIGALSTTTSKVPAKQGNKTIIMYNNVTVDARNKTEKEAVSFMTLALESMDNVDIDVDV